MCVRAGRGRIDAKPQATIVVWFTCPNCRRLSRAEGCPRCGAAVSDEYRARPYVDKLIWALGHPDNATRVRAADLLGRIGEARAVRPLINVIRSMPDVYVASVACHALAKIATDEALVFLRTLQSHPASMIRKVGRELAGQKEVGVAETTP